MSLSFTLFSWRMNEKKLIYQYKHVSFVALLTLNGGGRCLPENGFLWFGVDGMRHIWWFCGGVTVSDARTPVFQRPAQAGVGGAQVCVGQFALQRQVLILDVVLKVAVWTVAVILDLLAEANPFPRDLGAPAFFVPQQGCKLRPRAGLLLRDFGYVTLQVSIYLYPWEDAVLERSPRSFA